MLRYTNHNNKTDFRCYVYGDTIFHVMQKPESFQKVEYINRNFDSCVIKEKFDFLPSWQFSHFIGIFLS